MDLKGERTPFDAWEMIYFIAKSIFKVFKFLRGSSQERKKGDAVERKKNAFLRLNYDKIHA